MSFGKIILIFSYIRGFFSKIKKRRKILINIIRIKEFPSIWFQLYSFIFILLLFLIFFFNFCHSHRHHIVKENWLQENKENRRKKKPLCLFKNRKYENNMKNWRKNNKNKINEHQKNIIIIIILDAVLAGLAVSLGCVPNWM